MLKLDIVTHCWRYSRLLRYQLSSLVLNPPGGVQVLYTLFYASDDTATANVAHWIGQQEVPNVAWRFWELPTEQLLRRAIGRNLAAQASEADWIWFTDADYCFGPGCLDSLPQVLPDVPGPLAFPRITETHNQHVLGDRAVEDASDKLGIIMINPQEFSSRRNRRAIGGIQIARGDVCRTNGYCKNHRRYQSPVATKQFADCKCDRAFRVELGTAGHPIDVPSLFRIRHSRRGQDHFDLEL